MTSSDPSTAPNQKSSTNAIMLLFLTSSLYWLGFSMTRPGVSMYLAGSGLNAGMVGFLIALQALAPFLLAIPAGSLIDRIGYRKALALGSLLMGAGSVIYAVSAHTGSLVLLVSAQILTGFGSLFSWGALQSSVAVLSRSGDAEGAGSRRMNHLISNFTFFTSLAQFAGPSLGGILADHAGYVQLFAIAGAMTGITFLLSPFIPQWKHANEAAAGRGGTDEEEKRHWLLRFAGTYVKGYDMMRSNQVFFIGILLNGVLFILVDVRMTFFPIYMSGLHFTNTQIGFALSAGGIAAVIIRPLAGYLMSIMDHMRLMLTSIVLGAACLIVLAFDPVYWLILVVMFMWGACTGINQPIALLVVAKSVGMEEQGLGMSLRTMSNRIVQLMNPVAFGGIAAIVGISAGFGLLAVLLLAITGVFQVHQHSRKAGGEAALRNETRGSSMDG